MVLHPLWFHKLLWLPPALVILVTDCVTRHTMVSTWRDSRLMPTRAGNFAQTVQLNLSPETPTPGRSQVAG